MLELEEDFDDMKHPVVDEPKSEPYPSDIPACEPIRGGIPCEFLFCIFQFWIEGMKLRLVWLDFWDEMWIAFANPADVYFLHLTCRDILNKTSILSVVGGSAGVSLS